VFLALNSNTCTIDEFFQKAVNKYKKKFPKDKGAMLLAPNPKTCTKYKNKKENQLTNKNRE
jgi:hypothetical protein